MLSENWIVLHKYNKEILMAIEDSNDLYHAIELLLLSPIHYKLLRSQNIKLIDGFEVFKTLKPLIFEAMDKKNSYAIQRSI